MLRRTCVLACILTLSIVSQGTAEDKPSTEKADDKTAQAGAATQPDASKGPAAEVADLRVVLKSLAKALQDGNAEGITRAIYASGPVEKKMVEAMADMSVHIAKLYKVSVKAFGEEEAKGLTGDVAAEMTRIDKAEITVDGETATVRYPDEAPATATSTEDGEDSSSPPAGVPMVLKKVDGRWRVPMSELSKDTSPEEIEQRLADVRSQTKVIAELCGEIADGKYKTADKAAEAWQAKMMQALVPRKPEGDKAEK